MSSVHALGPIAIQRRDPITDPPLGTPAPPPRLNRRLVAKAATRERVLAAARFLFTNVGYFDTGIRDVADRAGMSTGAVFATVPDKPTLWRQAMGGPPPSLPLAEEVALIQALRPGWRFLFRFDGGRFMASLSARDYTPMGPNNRIYAGEGPSPAAALRAARLQADRHEPSRGPQ